VAALKSLRHAHHRAGRTPPWRTPLLGDFGGDKNAAIAAATRPNGSVNVAKVERLADVAVMRWLDERDAARAPGGAP
jgi:hypothetical protein